MWELEKQAPLPVLIYFRLTGSFKSVWTFKTEVTHHREHWSVTAGVQEGAPPVVPPSVWFWHQLKFCFVLFFLPSCFLQVWTFFWITLLHFVQCLDSFISQYIKKNTRSCRNVDRDVSPRLTDGDLLLGFTWLSFPTWVSAVFISSFCKDMTTFTDMTLLHLSYLLKTRSKTVSFWSTGEKIQHVQFLERQNPTHDHFQILCLALAFQSFSSAQRLMQNPQSSVTFLCVERKTMPTPDPHSLKGSLQLQFVHHKCR